VRVLSAEDGEFLAEAIRARLAMDSIVADENANPFTNSVKMTISSLPRKRGERSIISTVPRVGYAIARD